MAWEKRPGGRYYYRKKRIGRRVISEYVGAGLLAELIAELDQEERLLAAEKQAAFEAEVKAERDLVKRLNETESEIMALVKAVILANGYYKHHGQWRRKNGRRK